MPSDGFSAPENLGPLIAAWTARYVAKGCSPEKARRVAQARAWRKRTWPT